MQQSNKANKSTTMLLLKLRYYFSRLMAGNTGITRSESALPMVRTRFASNRAATVCGLPLSLTSLSRPRNLITSISASGCTDQDLAALSSGFATAGQAIRSRRG